MCMHGALGPEQVHRHQTMNQLGTYTAMYYNSIWKHNSQKQKN